MQIRRRALEYLRSAFDVPPPLRLAFWDGDSFEFAPDPLVTITVHSAEPARAFLHGRFARLGEAYVNGELAVEGKIEDVIHIGVMLCTRLEKTPAAKILKSMAPIFQRRRSRDVDVRYHYDVSNDFYRLWLDQRMIYSCAYFRDGNEDIETAQSQKLEHICRKLQLKPGDRLLDVGCGWGGLLRFALENYKIDGLGLTLSEQQYAYARELGIDVRLQDFLGFIGAADFDKIVSVGMYEHVGAENLPLYFQTVWRLLKPGGVFLHHGIVTTDPRGGARGPWGGGFIERYVFPGGSVSPLSIIITQMAEAGLEVVDVEDLRPHYARTLLCWSRRLEARAAEAIAAVGVERYRIWRVFLAGMAYAFDRGWLSVVQALAYKPMEFGPAPRPWTRAHQYSTQSEPPRALPLDWSSA